MTHRTRHAFTLVELLVVIAIIGLLVAILLPSLKAARETALVVRCSSNQRQLAIQGIGYYCNDYKGVMIPAVGAGPSTRYQQYPAYSLSSQALSETNGYSVSMWELLDYSKSVDTTVQQATDLQPIAYCPADIPWRTGPALYNPNYREATYGLNLLLSYLDHYSRPLSDYALKYYRAETVQRASDKLLFIENHHRGVHGARGSSSQVWNEADYAGCPMYPNDKWNVGDPRFVSRPRHDRGFTASYVDGHAGFVKHEPVKDNVYFYFAGGVSTSAYFYPTATQWKDIWFVGETMF